ncbi:Peptidyl-prolyl cis-trans isomerase PpiD [uncultured Candidatus Thioglobus sp.]|nr:Peptidyl-prolyl cis-trans isomerase PpiD [uncultured Candidatus Thioglobus sp.]
MFLLFKFFIFKYQFNPLTYMLSSIKNKIKGWLAYFIVGLITIPFALFGISEYFTSASNVVVANINDDQISKEEFLAEFNPQKRRLQQKLAEKYDIEFDAVLKQSIINQMVDRRLLDQLALKMSHTTTATELNKIIQANDLFSEEGRFSIDKYKQLLRLNGYTPAKYESIKAQELTQNQIKYNLLDSAFVLPSQLTRLQQLNDQQRNFSFIQLNAKDYTAKVKVDGQSVKDYYDNQKESFFAPEQVKIEFVELSLAEIAKKISVNDDDLFNFYEDEQARFTTDEERQAQHILIEDEKTANEVLELLNKGGDFSKLAAQYSQDTSSKDLAGDLGFFTRGVMVGAFEDSAFAMKEGDLSGLVKSEFGFHIIKLNKIKSGAVKSFDQVKSELVELYTQSQAQKDLYNLTEQMANLAYEANLEELAGQMGLKLQMTDFFNRQDTKLDTKMIKSVFSDTVLNKNENSEVLELGKNRYVVLHLKDKLPQRQKSFNEVKGEINTHLASLLSKTFVDNIAAQIVMHAKAGETSAIKKLMDKNSLSWTKVGWVKRDSSQADTSIINKVFSMTKPNSSSVFSAQSLSNQSALVIDLSALKTSTEQVPEKELESILIGFESNEVFVNILQTLRSQADIKIYNQSL